MVPRPPDGLSRRLPRGPGFWWAVPAFVAFVALVALSGTTLGFVALVLFAAFGALGAYRVVRGEGHRYPGVATLMEGRR